MKSYLIFAGVLMFGMGFLIPATTVTVLAGGGEEWNPCPNGQECLYPEPDGDCATGHYASCECTSGTCTPSYIHPFTKYIAFGPSNSCGYMAPDDCLILQTCAINSEGSILCDVEHPCFFQPPEVVQVSMWTASMSACEDPPGGEG